MIAIRQATDRDVDAIKALMAPEISQGTVLPRSIIPQDFLVAQEGSALVGTVALTAQSARVIELGTLISTRQGVGLGPKLVEAAMSEAETRGFDLVMALTSIPDFFEGVGFRVASHAPWISARQALAMPHPLPLAPTLDATLAAEAKSRACRACPLLQTCSQALLLRPIAAQRRKQA